MDDKRKKETETERAWKNETVIKCYIRCLSFASMEIAGRRSSKKVKMKRDKINRKKERKKDRGK